MVTTFFTQVYRVGSQARNGNDLNEAEVTW
jgi:hypothetical protein